MELRVGIRCRTREDLVQLEMHGVMPIVKIAKELGQIRVIDWLAGIIRYEVLLGHISDVIALVIFGQKVIKRLLFFRPTFFWDRFVPFIGIREHRIHVKDHAAKRMLAVTDNLTQCVFRTRFEHNKTPCKRY